MKSSALCAPQTIPIPAAIGDRHCFSCRWRHVQYDDSMAQMIENRTHLIESVVLKLRDSQESSGMGELEPQIRRALAEVDPNLTLIRMRSMQDQVAGRLDQQRTVAQLTGLFGILALVLAAVGLYGVTA